MSCLSPGVCKVIEPSRPDPIQVGFQAFRMFLQSQRLTWGYSPTATSILVYNPADVEPKAELQLTPDGAHVSVVWYPAVDATAGEWRPVPALVGQDRGDPVSPENLNPVEKLVLQAFGNPPSRPMPAHVPFVYIGDVCWGVKNWDGVRWILVDPEYPEFYGMALQHIEIQLSRLREIESELTEKYHYPSPGW